MNTRTRPLFALGGLLLLAAAFLLAASPALADVPPTTCTAVGGTRTCELWAKAGTLTLPDLTTVNIWGFAATAGGAAQLPGPPIVAIEGETLQVVLHNSLLTETMSLVFPGQLSWLDYTHEVTPGHAVTYTFVLTSPGTFLYEAGPTDNGGRQVAMGLYGGLVVRPLGALGQAYADPATAFDREALLVLSEIDPALNANPNAFDMYEFAPRYRLINGLAYTHTVEIGVAGGEALLLRYVNAGLNTHSMGVLGLRQHLVATDGKPIHPYTMVAEKIASGQTADALLAVPPAAVQGTRFALYDASLMLHNASQRLVANGPVAFGGMLTFIHVLTGTADAVAGPLASTVMVTPNPTTGAGGITLTVQLGAGATAAEFFTNTLGAPGTGTPMTVGGGGATANIGPATLATWPSGFIVFYVRATDGTTWGPVGSAVLNLDKTGPNSVGLSLTPNPTNGTRDVLLRATGDDHSTGRNPVVAATYSIPGGPTGLPLALARIDNPITAMTATIPAASVAGLLEGLHPVSIVSQDSLGNVGVPGIVTLTVDMTGPGAPALTLTPNALDLSVAPAVTNVRLEGTVSDPLVAGAQSLLANAEGFIDFAGANGTGFDLYPSDGLFDETSEGIYFEIPIATFLRLSQGSHTVIVHALDAAGNWGTLGTAIITIDRGATDTLGPNLSGAAVTPNPTGGAAGVTLSANAADVGLVSNVAGGQWFVTAGFVGAFQAADGAFDSPSEALTSAINVTTWPNGTHTINLVAYDSLFNFGPVANVILTVQNPTPLLVLADNFEAGNLAQWGGTVGNVAVTAAAAIGPARGSLGLQATTDGGAPAYARSFMPVGESSYRASFYYAPNGANMGALHQDILAGLYADAQIWGIQVEQDGASGYEVRGWVLSNGVPVYTDPTSIGNEPHKLAVRWEASKAASFSLLVDDQVVGQLTGLDTSAYAVHEVRLGPSANVDAAASGVQYFDSFEARRTMTLFLPTLLRNN